MISTPAKNRMSKPGPDILENSKIKQPLPD